SRNGADVAHESKTLGLMQRWINLVKVAGGLDAVQVGPNMDIEDFVGAVFADNKDATSTPEFAAVADILLAWKSITDNRSLQALPTPVRNVIVNLLQEWTL